MMNPEKTAKATIRYAQNEIRLATKVLEKEPDNEKQRKRKEYWENYLNDKISGDKQV